MPDEVSKHLSKISDKDGTIVLKYWMPNGADRETGEFVCKDKPAQEFIDATQALTAILHSKLHPMVVPEHAVTVTTVSIKGGGAESMSVIISGSCRADAGAVAINTPRLHQPSPENEKEGAAMLTPDQWEVIAELAKHAQAYLAGVRTPRTLGLSEGGDSGEEEDAEAPTMALG